jgi:hypothetical protein
VENHTSIRRHRLGRCEPAVRTRQEGFENRRGIHRDLVSSPSPRSGSVFLELSRIGDDVFRDQVRRH